MTDMEIKTWSEARYQKYLALRERPIKVGKFCEDEEGNTFMVVQLKAHVTENFDVATIEDVIAHMTFEVPVHELKRCVMLEELPGSL